MTIDKIETDQILSENEVEEKSIKSEVSEEIISSPSEKTEEAPEWQDLLGSGSIMKKILKTSDSDIKPQRRQKVTINYDLKLPDGTIVDSQQNFELTLGDCEVVQGLDVAIGLMSLNEKSALKIEPRLAFGTVGLPPKIPPNSDILYEIELIKIEPEDDPEFLSIAERKIQGNKKREKGNWWYQRGENTLAIQCYRRALDYLDEVENGMDPTIEKTEIITDAALQDLLEDRISVCNNMAAAQIKLELYDAALNSLQTVLRCQPNNIKALFRKAKVYKGKNDLQAALKCLKKADEVSPNNPDVQKELQHINKLIQKQKVSERELARRMFGEKNSTRKDKIKSPKKNWLVLSAALAASVAVGLVGVVTYRQKFV